MNKINLVKSSNKFNLIFLLYLVFIILALANILFWYLHFYTSYPNLDSYLRIFDFDNEKNIPTYFNAILLLLPIYYFIIILIHTISHKFYWFFLSLIFLFMFFDEMFSIHEMLINSIKNTFGLSGIFYYSWVVPMFFVVIIILLLFIRFFISLPHKTKINILISAMIYIIGAMGFEMVGGWWISNMSDGFFYKIITTIEESLEMIGLIYFFSTIFDYEKIFISNKA